MKRFGLLIIALVSIAVLAACNNSKEGERTETKKKTTDLSAALTVPKQAKVGDEVELKVTVTRDGKNYTKAKDVAFEAENEEANTDQMMIATLKDDTYVAKLKIKDEGNYVIKAHVTAEDGSHVMPSREMAVTGNNSQKNEKATDNTANKSAKQVTKHDERTHGNVTIIYNNPNSFKKDDKVNLSVSLKYKGEALSNASVRYQVITQFNGSKPIWINLQETSSGTYEAKHTFTQAGPYLLKLHAENGNGEDLHINDAKRFIVK